MIATTYRSPGPANPTELVHQCSVPASFSIDQPSLAPACCAAPAAQTPQCWIGPVVRSAFTR